MASPLILPKGRAIYALLTPPTKLLTLMMVTARFIEMLENFQHLTQPSSESRCHTTLISLAQTLEVKLVSLDGPLSVAEYRTTMKYI
jgi:hypothetical protein